MADVDMLPAGRRGKVPMHPQIKADLEMAAATDKLASAVDRGAAAIEHLATVMAPAVDGVVGLLEAQHKFCLFLSTHRLKIAVSIPTVATAVLGLSPNVARGLGELLAEVFKAFQ